MYRFSLVIATYGRKREVEKLLHSLINQTYDMSKVQILLIDQNTTIDLKTLVQKYDEILNIEYIHSDIIGTSINRNIGIRKAKGDIIAFPDDDSTYYEDTLKKVSEFFREHPEVDCCLGKIFDRKNKKNILRNWQDEKININFWNFFRNYSEIVMFVKHHKNRPCFFPNDLGPGRYFGSCEGIDYLVNHLLRCKKKVIYNPDIEVWHPIQKITDFKMRKIESYGLGFGAFCCKNNCIPIFILYIETIVYHLMKAALAFVKFDFKEFKLRKKYIVSRITGWIEWRNRALNKEK